MHLWGRLHDTFYDFAQVLVGNTDHGGVVNRGVRNEQVLGLLRVDVGSPRDDHVGLAIREVQIPIVIEISDVTNRARITDEVSRFGGLRRIVEVLEVRVPAEPHRARGPGRTGFAIVVEDENLADDRMTHCALVSEPVVRVAEREAVSLSRGVVLDDDRPEPRDHLLFDRNRTRGSRVDDHLERRNVRSALHFFRQLQKAREHGRHDLRMSHPVSADQLEVLSRVEVFHYDGRGAEADRERHTCVWCRVIQGCWRQVDHSFPEPPQGPESLEEGQARTRVDIWQRTDYPLGLAGGARRVEHRRSKLFAFDRLGPMRCDRFGPGLERRFRMLGADHDPALDIRAEWRKT